MPSSIRVRLLLWFWALLLAAMVPVYFFTTSAVKNDLVEHSRLRALHQLDTACWLLSEHGPFAGDAVSDSWVKNYGTNLGSRLTLLESGHVVLDSDVPLAGVPDMEDHSHRPEVIAALKGEIGVDVRRSATLSRDLIYVARSCPVPALKSPTVARIALPVAELDQQVRGLKLRFLGILALGLGISTLLSFWATHGLTSSIRELSGLVADIGRGAYGRRVRVFTGSEFTPLVDAVNRMAGDIQRHVGVVEEQKAELEALFNGLSEGVMTVDGEGRLASCNHAFKEMFPGAAGAEGKSVIEATLDAELARVVGRALSHGTERGAERVVFAGPEGREIEARVDAYADPSGERRAVVVVQDLSQLRRLEKVRRDFVANVSHELRTPLTSIKGYAETLAALPPEKAAEGSRFLGVILRNADHMSRMVDSLLALSRWESSQPGTRTEPVNARRLAEEAIQSLWPQAQAKTVRMELNAPDDLPEVMGDEAGLADVFRNLLDNALKYSPEGGCVRVDASRGKGRVAFRVADEGPGIPPHVRERIFERFYRVGEGPGKKDGGAGLGLAICRNIVLALGGSIWVESPPHDGPGSVFAFDLPEAVEQDGADAPKQG